MYLNRSSRLGKSRKTSLMALCSNCDCSDTPSLTCALGSVRFRKMCCPQKIIVLAGIFILTFVEDTLCKSCILREPFCNRDIPKAQSSLVPALCTSEQICFGTWTSASLISEKSKWLQLMLCDALQVPPLEVIVGPQLVKGGFAAFSNLGAVGLASSFKHQSADVTFKLSFEGFCNTSFTLFGLNLDRRRLVLLWWLVIASRARLLFRHKWLWAWSRLWWWGSCSRNLLLFWTSLWWRNLRNRFQEGRSRWCRWHSCGHAGESGFLLGRFIFFCWFNCCCHCLWNFRCRWCRSSIFRRCLRSISLWWCLWTFNLWRSFGTLSNWWWFWCFTFWRGRQQPAVCIAWHTRCLSHTGWRRLHFSWENQWCSGRASWGGQRCGSRSLRRFCLVGLHKFLNPNFSPAAVSRLCRVLMSPIEVGLLFSIVDRDDKLWRNHVTGQNSIRWCLEENYPAANSFWHGHTNLDGTLSPEPTDVLLVTDLHLAEVGVRSSWWDAFSTTGDKSVTKNSFPITLRSTVIDYPRTLVSSRDLLPLCIHSLNSSCPRTCVDLDSVEGIRCCCCVHCTLGVPLHCTDSERPIGQLFMGCLLVPGNALELKAALAVMIEECNQFLNWHGVHLFGKHLVEYSKEVIQVHPHFLIESSCILTWLATGHSIEFCLVTIHSIRVSQLVSTIHLPACFGDEFIRMTINNTMLNHLRVDVLVKHDPVLFRMAFGMLWSLGWARQLRRPSVILALQVEPWQMDLEEQHGWLWPFPLMDLPIPWRPVHPKGSLLRHRHPAPRHQWVHRAIPVP